ncbi:hypothetical protein Syun_001921 [Stephania yunnanensis]|uniref:Uncharacterized protein n=1 Tax=Stephania yunnanensis TaxID=152371 RepID=A0AAP0QBD8_9MAGN
MLVFIGLKVNIENFTFFSLQSCLYGRSILLAFHSIPFLYAAATSSRTGEIGI